MVWQVHQHGFQAAIHAVEEAPVCTALEAIQQAQQRQPRHDHRHRIEHCTLCPPSFLDMLAETGSAVVMQPGFLHFYGDKYATEIDPDLHGWLYRVKSLQEQGIPVVGSSDCPIAPLSPLVGIQAAITRQSQTGMSLNLSERLSLTEAITLFTKAGAWVGFEESQAGRVAPGMRSDLVVLDSDLTTLPSERIGSAAIQTTIIGGQIVWSV
jgi:predicted amidohydrolase YtcJ